MPNICTYYMKIEGARTAIDRVIRCLQADYNYNLKIAPPSKHFFRIFDVNADEKPEDNGDGTFTKHVWGTCAWSVHSCMTDDASSYYRECEGEHKNIFMGTCLREQSEDCEIEVFSEEMGLGFIEHYYYKNGEKIIEEVDDTAHEVGLDEDGNQIEVDAWDEYDGDIQICSRLYDPDINSFKWIL